MGKRAGFWTQMSQTKSLWIAHGDLGTLSSFLIRKYYRFTFINDDLLTVIKGRNIFQWTKIIRLIYFAQEPEIQLPVFEKEFL